MCGFAGKLPARRTVASQKRSSLQNLRCFFIDVHRMFLAGICENTFSTRGVGRAEIFFVAQAWR